MKLTRIFLLALCLLAFAPPDLHAGDSAITSTTSSGTVDAGNQEVTFIFSTDFVGTIKGVSFAGAADSSITLRARSGDTLRAIAYTVSAGTLRIVRVF